MRMCHFRAQNTPICPEQNILVQTIITTFIYLLTLFIGKISKKNYMADPGLWGCTIFGPKWSICPRQNFFWKIINITLIYLLAPFILTNFIKILPAGPDLWCAIFGPKMAHFSKLEFFQENLLMSLVSFIHAYLHAKNQSHIFIS